jgi:phage antirepressor YoqD-like protein
MKNKLVNKRIEMGQLKKKTITSLEVVEQLNIFRKVEGKEELRHDNFMQKVREEFEEEISLLKIQVSEYTNSRGRKYPCFELTHDQAKQMMMSESKTVRKAMIHYINELEEKVEALEELLIREKEIEANRHKVEYHDIVLDTDNCMNVTQIAKELGMTAKTLNKLLCDYGIQFKQGNTWVLKAKYDGLGYTKMRTSVIDDQSYHQTVWTEKGRKFINELFRGK